MKRIFATAALAATMLFAACSNDSGENANTPEQGVETVMGLSFTMPNPQDTRIADGGDVTATPEESDVKTVQVFIFNNDGTYDSKQGYYELDKGDFIPAGTTYTLKDDKAIQVMTGGKRVYVGINLPANFKGKTNVGSEVALKAAKDFLINGTVSAENTKKELVLNGMAMFSDEVATPVLSPKAEGSTATPAENMVEMDVTRMIAKVVAQTNQPVNQFAAVKYNDGNANAFTAAYDVKGYAIGQSSTSMYTAKQVVSGKLVTPGVVNNTFDIVAASFAGMNNSALGETNFNTHTYKYTGENASKNGIVKEATYVLVKTKVRPSKKAVIDGGTGNIKLDDADFSTAEDMWIVRGQVTGDQQEIYFCINETDANAVSFKCNGTFQKYPGCYAYFRVWLNLTNNVTDKLAVYRNQFVHVMINDISGSKFRATPGTDPTDGEDPEDPTNPEDPKDPQDPNKPDPTDPIIEQETDMLVKITLKPWTYIKNAVVLGR